MSEDRTPILVGAAQLTQRDVEPAAALEPLAMMTETARRAASDAGSGASLLEQVDTIAVVNILGWPYGNAPGMLAERLGAHPKRRIYTTVGGNTPQWLVNELAEQIAAGGVRLALIGGAEAINTLVRARRAGVRLDWTLGGEGSPTVVGSTQPGSNEHEVNHGLQMPTAIYPLFENALRAHYGWSIAEHRRRLGQLCARFSAVAAQNPYAWFRQARSADDIAAVTRENRFIGFPYTKYMNAIMDVDQAAAVIMTSAGTARQLGIDPSRWVYLRGCGDATDLWYLSQRVSYYSSPAIAAAGRQALGAAGVGIEQIDFFDLYSCFPAAVQIARDMLGIARDDARPLTVTGGLPYHGGPGNNYTLHAVATMMDKLRAAPGKFGLVTGLGWYMTKHAAGVYSTAPPDEPWQRPDGTGDQDEIDRMPHPALAYSADGRGSIEAYTVMHDREGNPMRGIVIGRLDDGRRFLANTPEERTVLESLMSDEAVGRPGIASARDGMNHFDPA